MAAPSSDLQRYDKTILLAKIESTYGQDPTPAAATNVIITKGVPTFEIVGNARQRNVPLAYMGSLVPVNVGEALKISFTTELKGSGTAGTVSVYGCLFRACGMTEDILAETSVTYTVHSVMESESVAFYFWVDGVKHIILGAVGTCKLNFKSMEIAEVQWEFTGLYASGGGGAAAVAFPSPTYEAIAPIIWKGGNFKYGANTTMAIESLTVDIGNSVTKRVSANAATGVQRYIISKRESKGNFNPEAQLLSTFNPYTTWDASTTAVIETKPAGTAGNLVEVITGPIGLDVPKFADRENIKVWDLGFTMHPTLDKGNDQLSIVFK